MPSIYVCLSQAFGQFDAEGDGVVDVESMLIALKNSNGANLKGELSHVIRQLQACSLTPGMRCDLFTRISSLNICCQQMAAELTLNISLHRFC